MTFDEATIEDLLRELSRRSPAVVVAMLRPDDRDMNQIMTFVHGNRLNIYALGKVAANAGHKKLFKYLDDNQKPKNLGEGDDHDGD